MHHDRNNGTWSELKAKRQRRYDDEPVESTQVKRGSLYGETHDSHKEKKERAAKQLADVHNMFKDMADYADKQDKHN